MPSRLVRYSLCCLFVAGGFEARADYSTWAAFYFGTADAVDAAPGADPDQDGIPNLREYAFQLDPEAASISPEEGGILQHTDGKHYLYISFPLRTDRTDLTFEVRSRDEVVDLCDGDVPYLWENGSVISDDGLVGSQGTSPATLTVIDKDVPLEGSNLDRGFLQLFIVLANETPIDFVEVGDPGEGDVNYTFEIGECEITNAQYVEFLNAVASADDRVRHLTGEVHKAPMYVAKMTSEARGGIRRHGSKGSYTYTVKPKMANKPVNFVSFWSACRYCNWLHNGKPKPRCRRATPATSEDGVYDLTDLVAVENNTVARKAGAKYFLPSKPEWKKAAYFDPTRAGSDKFWKYSTRSDDKPVEAIASLTSGDISNPGANVVNYNKAADWDSNGNGVVENAMNGNTIGPEDGNVTSVASAGLNSRSYYGAADMDGSVVEWTDFQRLGWGRDALGGSFNHGDSQIGRLPDNFDYTQAVASPLKETGFRVCRILP